MNADQYVIAAMQGLGIDPLSMQRSASGRSWHPRNHFSPPINTGTLFDSGTGKLFAFREDQISVLLSHGYAVRKTSGNPKWHGFRHSLRRMTSSAAGDPA